MARKIFAYGMDGLITPMMKYFAKEGVLPTFQRMLDGGTINQTLPSFPVWTPTNWATLSVSSLFSQLSPPAFLSPSTASATSVLMALSSWNGMTCLWRIRPL